MLFLEIFLAINRPYFALHSILNNVFNAHNLTHKSHNPWRYHEKKKKKTKNQKKKTKSDRAGV